MENILYQTLSESERLFCQGKALSNKMGTASIYCTEPVRGLIQHDGWIPTVDVQVAHVNAAKNSLSILREKIVEVEKWLVDVETDINNQRVKENEATKANSLCR